jgi:hypothetical protein
MNTSVGSNARRAQRKNPATQPLLRPRLGSGEDNVAAIALADRGVKL